MRGSSKGEFIGQPRAALAELVDDGAMPIRSAR